MYFKHKADLNKWLKAHFCTTLGSFKSQYLNVKQPSFWELFCGLEFLRQKTKAPEAHRNGIRD